MHTKHVLYWTLLCLVTVAGGGCGSLGTDGSFVSQESAGTSSNALEFLIGDCVLPPRTRTTGGLVIEIPRPPLKTTRQQCARENGRIVSAQQAWGPEASQGNVEAQMYLANAQSRGDQGPKDCRQAAELYQQVIASGAPGEQASAHFSLAYLYETGCGVKRDLDRARALYAKALDLQDAPAGSGGVRVKFGRFYALVIGNNNYHPALPQLAMAINDAREVAQILETHYGFKIKLLIDATRDAILESLEDLRRRLTETDNLLIYYAGHGVLYNEQDKRGAWLPIGARRDSSTHWIKTEDVTDIVDRMLAYRVLIVADSCFSGAWTRSVFPDLYPEKVAYWIERLARKRARLVLASGGLEPVPDSGGGEHSVFAKYFIQALQENTDILVGRRLFDYLDLHVPYEAKQSPVYAPMRFVTEHEGGEFFFKRMDSTASGRTASTVLWTKTLARGKQ